VDRKILLYVLGAAVLGIVGVMLLPPPERDDGVARLPWLVSVDDQGRSQVFGFTIGVTTLADVRRVLGEEGKITLFARAQDPAPYAAEAYFEQVYLDRLRADLVFTLAADQSDLEAMYGRGLRISQLASGAKKVELAPGDLAVLAQRPIHSITYLPWQALDATILQKRFGEPAQRLAEEGGVVHWLYPARGMDIAVDGDGGAVIQYVDPADFQLVVTPLTRPKP